VTVNSEINISGLGRFRITINAVNSNIIFRIIKSIESEKFNVEVSKANDGKVVVELVPSGTFQRSVEYGLAYAYISGSNATLTIMIYDKSSSGMEVLRRFLNYVENYLSMKGVKTIKLINIGNIPLNILLELGYSYTGIYSFIKTVQPSYIF
jgi:hypothetical protein